MASYSIPYVVEQTSRGERTSDIYSRLLSDRIVYLGTEIDDGVANVIIAQLLHLQSVDSDAQINLYINSPGGSATAMFGIYDTMRFLRPAVATYCVGQAASAGAVIFAAGEPGRRLVLPHARILLHPPSMESQGTLPDLAVQAAEITRLRNLQDEVLAYHTGRSVPELQRDIQRDRVFTATEAVEYGLADEIVSLPAG
ncbi:ClpP family protease [Naumannella huperziae]